MTEKIRNTYLIRS